MLTGLGKKQRAVRSRLSEMGLSDEEADAESRWMICQITGASAALLPADVPFSFSEADEARLEKILKGREEGIPLAYLLGETEFFGRTFSVGEGVLIPRQDTEILVEEALNFLSGRPAALGLELNCRLPEVWDLCAGSGCVGLSLAAETPLIEVHLLEKEPAALAWLLKNEARFALPNTSVHPGDLFAFDLPQSGSVDLIVSNPPYIPAGDLAGLQREVTNEPASALNGGTDGLDFYRELTGRWLTCLKPGGGLFAEIGYDQGEAVCGLFRQAGLCDVACVKDLGGRDRVVRGIMPESR